MGRVNGPHRLGWPAIVGLILAFVIVCGFVGYLGWNAFVSGGDSRETASALPPVKSADPPPRSSGMAAAEVAAPEPESMSETEAPPPPAAETVIPLSAPPSTTVPSASPAPRSAKGAMAPMALPPAPESIPDIAPEPEPSPEDVTRGAAPPEEEGGYEAAETGNEAPASEAPAPEAPASGRVERFPTMECPDEVKVRQPFALMVSLTEDQITPDVKIRAGQATDEGALAMDLPESPTGWKIDVVLSAPGFDFVQGTNTASIDLPAQGDSTPALFRLAAQKPGKPGKPGVIYATFWHEGAFLAKVSKSVGLIDPEAPGAVNVRSAKSPGPTASASAPAGAPSPTPPVSPSPRPVQAERPVDVGPAPDPVDLTVYIIENLDPEQPQKSEIIIASPYLQPTLQKYETPAQADEWLRFHYDKFVQALIEMIQAESSGQAAHRTARLKMSALMEGFGDELYQKFAPQPFRNAFWRLYDRLGPEFDTIQIFSNNPVIPWELMRPSRPDGSDIRPFIGLDFTIGRWHVSHQSRQLDRPPSSLPVEELIVVAPGYGEEADLPGQSDEMRLLAGFDGFRRAPGSLESVEELLGRSPHGIIHFAGHGRARPTSEGVYEYFISLEDAALDLTTFRGLTRSRTFSGHPFFFFNACEMGKTSKVADFVSGWAPAVLEAGASGFVGALWPVDDRGAARFAARFYQTLGERMEGGPVNPAELLRQARRLYLEEGNPTYLSFIYYGDPNLKMARP